MLTYADAAPALLSACGEHGSRCAATADVLAATACEYLYVRGGGGGAARKAGGGDDAAAAAAAAGGGGVAVAWGGGRVVTGMPDGSVGSC